MVGVRGFEPPTSWSQTMRASRCATPRMKGSFKRCMSAPIGCPEEIIMGKGLPAQLFVKRKSAYLCSSDDKGGKDRPRPDRQSRAKDMENVYELPVR